MGESIIDDTLSHDVTEMFIETAATDYMYLYTQLSVSCLCSCNAKFITRSRNKTKQELLYSNMFTSLIPQIPPLRSFGLHYGLD